MMGRQGRRLIFSALVLALSLSVSHCSQKQSALKVRGLKPDEAATLTAAYHPWEAPPASPRPDRKGLPRDRLEAMADLALQNRDFETSLVNLLEILKENPQRYDLRYKVGLIFFLTGQMEAARRELALVLVHRPEMVEAHEALGLVHVQEKHYTLAIEEFQTVLAQEPRRAKTRHLLGVCYLEAGQPGRAISELRGAAALDPRQVSTYIALGQAYLQLKDYPQAITWLKKGQSLAPQNQKASYHLGMALAAGKRYPEALEAFIQAGDEAQAFNNIGVHYFGEERYEEAARCFQRALELRPTFYQEAKVNLHRTLEKLQQSQ